MCCLKSVDIRVSISKLEIFKGRLTVPNINSNNFNKFLSTNVTTKGQ